MIRITIHSFRGVGATKEDPEPKIYTFSRGLNLLKGESGKGKSTIINAFRWCLYKEPLTGNNSLLKNMLCKSPKVMVEFKTAELDLTITRSSSPNQLEVRCNEHGQGHILVNEEAEAYLENVFGKEHFWRTCCFIQQGYHNPILEGLSAVEKREVFQNMTANSLCNKLVVDIPMDTMRTRISDMRRQLESEEKVKEGVLKTMEEHYRKMSTEISKPQFDKPYSAEDVYQEGWNIPITRIMTELQNLAVTDDNLLAIMEQTKELEARLKKIHQTSSEVEGRRAIYEGIIERNQKQLREHARAQQTIMDLGKKYPQIVQAKKWLDNNTVQEYLDRLIGAHAFVKGCSEYFKHMGTPDNGQDRWAKYGSSLQDDANNMANYKEYIQNTAVKAQLLAKVENSIGSLRTNEEKLLHLQQTEPWLKEETNCQDLRTQLSNQLKSMDGQVVSCPSCRKHLLVRTIGSQVQSYPFDRQESVETYRKTIHNRIAILDQAIHYSKTIQEQKEQLQALEDRIDNVIVDEQYAISADKLRYMETHAKHLLQEWTALKKGVPGQVLEEISKNLDGSLLYDLQMAMKNISNLISHTMITEQTNAIEQAKTDISLLNIHAHQEEKALEKKLIEDIQDRKLQLNRLKRRGELMQKLQTHVGLNTVRLLKEPDYLEFLVELHNYRKELANYEGQSKRLSSYADEITTVQNQMTDIRKKINHLLELNKILDETEEEIFEHTIAIMVSKINDLLENFFEQNPPKLIVKNENKKTAKTSRDIQFMFANTDSQADSARGLATFSGGEADRLSLAFTCAVAEFSDCPLLFLDECISSLDVELRDRVIRTLRSVVKNKFVIVVCHDTLDGLFDKIVSV